MSRGYRHAPNFQYEHTRYDSRSLLLGGDRLDGLPVPPGYSDSNELDLSGLTVLWAILQRIPTGCKRRATGTAAFSVKETTISILSTATGSAALVNSTTERLS